MKSMTGYAQAEVRRGAVASAVEVRSVNHRFLDIRVNAPREFAGWEAELRSLVQARASRGRIEVSVAAGAERRRVAVEADVAAARAYAAAWRRLQRATGLPGRIDIGFLQGRPELFRIVEVRPDPRVALPAVRRALERALSAWDRERRREGRVLARDMAARVRRLQRLRRAMARRAEKMPAALAQRLRERLRALAAEEAIPGERIAQEAMLLAERSDVTEELVRLQSHLEGLARLLRAAGPVGRRLDFLLQEAHREVNTIAAKSADLGITELTLEARAEIEKLREQAQNVE